MKCLFISTEHSVFKKPVQEAFIRAGVDVLFFDYRGHVFLERDSIIHRMVAALPFGLRNKIFRYFERNVNEKLLKLAQDYKPSLIFAIKAKEVDAKTLERLRKIASTANWYPETVDHWGGIQDAAPHYDYFFTFEPLVVDRLKEQGHKNVHYLPFCADVKSNEPWPQESVEPIYNVSFIGSYHRVRAAREHILARVADLGLHIWGSNAWEQTSLKDYYKGTISNDDMIDVYRKSKVVINYYTTDVPGDGINLRPFEVAGAGAMLINHDARADIFKHFEDGKEFISFHSDDDIREKVLYYMEHENERRLIAKNGFLRTQKDHTYDLRVKEILKITNLN